MMARSPRENLTDRLAHPDTAFSLALTTATRHPAAASAEFVQNDERSRAASLFHESNWGELYDLYDRLAERAWKANCRTEALRLHIAARAVAKRAGDVAALLDTTRFLAERHRLSTAFLAAEAWNLQQLTTSPTPETAMYHVIAWRARSELCEPVAAYESAVVFSDQSLAVAQRFPAAPGVARARTQTLLQRGNTERLRGHLETAYAFLREARQQAEQLQGKDASAHIQGLIARAHARMDVTVGHFESALSMYLEAEDYFRKSESSVNVRVVRVARVAALRLLGRFPEALALCRELAQECEELGQDRTRGQILLEQAEVLEEMDEGEEAGHILEQARRYHEGRRTLEAARWNRHMGRRLIISKGDMERAAAHLTTSLDIAIRDEGPDLTRTWYVLHDLSRLEIFDPLRLVASRTALVGADLQRDRLSLPRNRWALHEQREEVYAGALMVHTAAQQHEDVARIVELGRSDVLDHILENPTRGTHQSLTELPLVLPPSDPDRVQEVFRSARAIHTALTGDPAGSSRIEAPTLPGRLPSATEADALADVVVLLQVGRGSEGWWSSVASRTRHGSWHASRQTAPPELDALLSLLATGEPLPEYGISDRTWEALGRFLLPHDTAWGGTTEHPLSLLLSPDLRLWQLPYGALRRDGVCLLDVAEVTLTPSLRTQSLLHRAHTSTDPVPEAAAAPAASVLDPQLNGHQNENEALSAWPGSHLHLDTLDPARDLTTAALLYLSGLGDAAGATRLGPLGITLDLLAALRLPRLLILNGCWTGTAASRYGRDPLSLAVGGLLGGARTVVAGIGYINSWSSAQVGAAVLSSIARGETPGSALRQAQRTLRNTYPELGPYDWAGMCLIGLGEQPLVH
ncbi:CHAT domain-containing protein [Streptomyces gilvifuscus]|uniref:CHAT domain-containing protein n=1 Tax=Streptomyces gilvifuscus TaxID=1550617 RepID=A0ABT5G6A6_9ACTN|nr:CHAT domain-containing protein [Streptomyces gilvifuscus]MDC2960390.1 CHAT domain-containing protein [Streptomyces gilvifuscus]